MLVETSTVRPEEREYGWRMLGSVRVVVSEHPVFSGLTFRHVDETEACPDALVRDERDRLLVLRDLENDGLPDTLLIYCYREPSAEAMTDFLAAAGLSDGDVMWRNWVADSCRIRSRCAVEGADSGGAAWVDGLGARQGPVAS